MKLRTFRGTASLREFANIIPVNFWFEYPIHRLDDKGILSESPAQGTTKAKNVNNPRCKTKDQSAEEFRNAYAACNMTGEVSVKDMCEYLGCSDKTIYARLKKLNGEFVLEHGLIKPGNPDEQGVSE